MGHKHAREEILAAAVQVAAEDGLHRLSFGRVAQAAGTSDRVVVYYFARKDDLVAAVLTDLGERLQAALAAAVPHPLPDHRALVVAAWPVLSRQEHAGAFRSYVEAVGLAAAGAAPYAALAPLLLEGWVAWLEGRLDLGHAKDAEDSGADELRDEALAAVALVDGLLLVSVVGGAESAERALRRLSRRP